MKKLISLLLIFTLCLGCFVGCAEAPADQETQPSESGPSAAELDKAREFLFTLYKDASNETSAPYSVVSQVRVGNFTFPITWTANVGEDIVKITPDEASKTTQIGINETLAEDTAYTLTATIQGANGETRTIEYNRTIVSVKKIIDAAYALQAGEAMEGEQMLKGTISRVDTPYDSGYGNITVTIQVKGFEDKPIKCYRLKGEGADGLKVGDIIIVSGIIKNYNGTIEFDSGCQIAEIVFSAEPEPEAPSITGTFTKVTELNSGDKIIVVNPAHNKALSMVKTGYYNVGIDVDAAAGNFSNITAEEVLVVTKNDDGTFGFATEGGKILALAADFSSLNEEGENTAWQLVDAGDGNFHILNVGRDRYLEWYADKNNWSTHNPGADKLDGLFIMEIYKLA